MITAFICAFVLGYSQENSVKEQITHAQKIGESRGGFRISQRRRANSKGSWGGWRHLLFGQMFPKIARKLRKSDWEGAWVNILLCRSATGKSNVEKALPVLHPISLKGLPSK